MQDDLASIDWTGKSQMVYSRAGRAEQGIARSSKVGSRLRWTEGFNQGMSTNRSRLRPVSPPHRPSLTGLARLHMLPWLVGQLTAVIGQCFFVICRFWWVFKSFPKGQLPSRSGGGSHADRCHGNIPMGKLGGWGCVTQTEDTTMREES